MEYIVELKRNNEVYFGFDDGECTPVDIINNEPNSIDGEILLNDQRIGFLLIYELENHFGFYDKCDDYSGDLEAIASVICDSSGKVSKEYLSNENEYGTIFILDRIHVYDRYQNMGIGTSVMKNLLYMLEYQFDVEGTIFLYASDYETAMEYGFESSEYQAGCDRLMAFYERSGFKVIKDNVMVFRK